MKTTILKKTPEKQDINDPDKISFINSKVMTTHMNAPPGGEGWNYLFFDKKVVTAELEVQKDKNTIERCFIENDPYAGITISSASSYKSSDFSIRKQIEAAKKGKTLLLYLAQVQQCNKSIIAVYEDRSIDEIVQEHVHQWSTFKPKKWDYLYQPFVESPKVIHALIKGEVPPPLGIIVLNIEENCVGKYWVEVVFHAPMKVDSIDGMALTTQDYTLSKIDCERRYKPDKLKDLVDSANEYFMYEGWKRNASVIQIYDPHCSIQDVVSQHCELIMNKRYKKIIEPFNG